MVIVIVIIHIIPSPQGGLIANMVMAVVVLGRRYSASKCLSVGMITLGTLVCTYASAHSLVCAGVVYTVFMYEKLSCLTFMCILIIVMVLCKFLDTDTYGY